MVSIPCWFLKIPMILGVDPDGPRIDIIECPADIVMAPQVIQPERAGLQGLSVRQRLLQEPRFPCGQTFPQQGHEIRVV